MCTYFRFYQQILYKNNIKNPEHLPCYTLIRVPIKLTIDTSKSQNCIDHNDIMVDYDACVNI